MIDMLLHTNGKFSYKIMEVNLGEVVSINAILRHVQILEGFKHSRIRLLPLLDSASKEKIVRCSETLWLFWKIAMSVAPRVKFVFYHMDENRFYAVVNRAMERVVACIGLEPVEH